MANYFNGNILKVVEKFFNGNIKDTGIKFLLYGTLAEILHAKMVLTKVWAAQCMPSSLLSAFTQTTL
jgi:hypothetical protein